MTAVLSLSPLLFVQDIARRGVDAGDRSVRHGRSGVRAPAGDQPQNPDAHNAKGTTFVWTATADQILAKVARGRVALEKVNQLLRHTANGDSPQPDEACGSHVTLLGAPVGQDDP